MLEAPEPATADQLATIHAPAYVEAVRTGDPADLAEGNGFTWDPGMFVSTATSTGGAAAAALRALETGTAGSLSSGLHHARRAGGAGFCTFNGLALAAKTALAAGVTGVLVIDLDAHCGGGTAELLAGDPRVASVDLAVSAYDFYPERGRFTLDVIGDADLYLPTLRRRLAELDRVDIGLVLYNAGMDPYEGCPVGGRHGVTAELLAEREETVFAWCAAVDLPVAFVLAGGYIGKNLTEAALVDLHRLTLEAAARHA